MKTWKKLTVCCVSFIAVFALGVAIDLACGPETDPYDYYTTFFHNNLPGNNDYRSFYFNGYSFLNDENEQVSEAEINAAEWANYLGNGVSAGDVQYAMYKFKFVTDSTLLKSYLLPNHNLPDSLKNNTFLTALVTSKRPGALEYYRFTKALEPVTRGYTDDAWNPTPIDTPLLQKKAAEAFDAAGKAPDSFLKLRYYYQAQRLLHYAGKKKEAMQVYDEHIAHMRSKSHVMGWALSLKAGEEWDANNNVKAAYLFSRVFDEYPERRVQAYLNFRHIPIDEADILKMADNNHERAIICAIQGFNMPNPGLEALEKVYRYEPKSPLVEVLLIREINKIEESYVSPKLYKAINDRNADSYYTADTTMNKYAAFVPKLETFCKKLAVENKCADAGLGYLALAYLDWVQQRTTDGFSNLTALDNIKLNNRLNDQKQLIKLLLLSQKIKTRGAVNESELLPSLKWLDEKVQWEAVKGNVNIPADDDNYWGNYDLKFFSASARDFYNLVLMPAYLKRKDTVMAALAVLKSERTIVTPPGSEKILLGYNLPDFWQRNLHSRDVKTILKWKADANCRPYLKRLMSAVDKSDIDDIHDLLGTAYLREHNYKQAIAAFKRIPLAKLAQSPSDDYMDDSNLYADPFASQIPDYPKLYADSKSKNYTPLMFAQTMADLENKVKTDPKNAAAFYYKLATGLYNTSSYGNAWYYISYSWTSYDYTRKPADYYDADFLQAKNAEKYYLQARALSHDNEFKARCTFMAAKCKQKQTVYPEDEYPQPKNYEASVDRYNYNIRHNPYFGELKNSYSGTAFFKLAVSECSYLKDFLHGKKVVKKK